MKLIKDLIYKISINNYINLKIKLNLIKNLIFKKELYQDKELLEQLKNVKVNLIKLIMQSNILNKINFKQILQNYKQVNK